MTYPATRDTLPTIGNGSALDPLQVDAGWRLEEAVEDYLGLSGDSASLAGTISGKVAWLIALASGKWGTSTPSAATLVLPLDGDIIPISGTTAITSITVNSSALQRRVTLLFLGATTLTSGNNLKLDQNYVTAAGYTITLACDGTNWYEVSRSHGGAGHTIESAEVAQTQRAKLDFTGPLQAADDAPNNRTTVTVRSASLTDAHVAAANKDGLVGAPSLRTIGTGAQQAAAGSHHTQHEPGGADALTVDAAANVGSLRTLGSGAQQAVAGNDPRLETATPSLLRNFFWGG